MRIFSDVRKEIFRCISVIKVSIVVMGCFSSKIKGMGPNQNRYPCICIIGKVIIIDAKNGHEQPKDSHNMLICYTAKQTIFMTFERIETITAATTKSFYLFDLIESFHSFSLSALFPRKIKKKTEKTEKERDTEKN